MTSPTPCRATDGSQAGGQSRDLPQRTSLRQFLAAEFREGLVIVVVFMALGFAGYCLFLASLQGLVG